MKWLVCAWDFIKLIWQSKEWPPLTAFERSGATRSSLLPRLLDPQLSSLCTTKTTPQHAFGTTERRLGLIHTISRNWLVSRILECCWFTIEVVRWSTRYACPRKWVIWSEVTDINKLIEFSIVENPWLQHWELGNSLKNVEQIWLPWLWFVLQFPWLMSIHWQKIVPI